MLRHLQPESCSQPYFIPITIPSILLQIARCLVTLAAHGNIHRATSIESQLMSQLRNQGCLNSCLVYPGLDHLAARILPQVSRNGGGLHCIGLLIYETYKLTTPEAIVG
jgi:hypothetical protein